MLKITNPATDLLAEVDWSAQAAAVALTRVTIEGRALHMETKDRDAAHRLATFTRAHVVDQGGAHPPQTLQETSRGVRIVLTVHQVDLTITGPGQPDDVGPYQPLPAPVVTVDLVTSTTTSAGHYLAECHECLWDHRHEIRGLVEDQAREHRADHRAGYARRAG